MNAAVKFYKDVLHHDNMDIEAIACIGTFYFYTDQPEVALKFYRWGLSCGTVEPLWRDHLSVWSEMGGGLLLGAK